MTVTLARRSWAEQIMGLPISVHLRGERPGGPDAQEAVARVFAELRQVDAELSPYRDDSVLSRWERGEAGAGPMLTEVRELCELARQATGGLFDAQGLPDPRTGRPRFDPSGLVKGWAAERASRHLAGLGEYCWYLNAGGDIRVHATAGRPAWRVGIENPADPRTVMQVVESRGGAVATSGTTHRGRHIVDPRTGRPATALRAVTVIGPDLMWADVHATAAVVGGLGLVEALDGYEALAVTTSGLVRTTAGWPV